MQGTQIKNSLNEYLSTTIFDAEPDERIEFCSSCEKRI